MNKKLSPTRNRLCLLLWSLLALVSLVVIVWSPRGFLHLRQLHLEYRELTRKNQVLERENHRLYGEIDRLLNDPTALERLAREELGLVKEGELVFQFVPPTDDATNRVDR